MMQTNKILRTAAICGAAAVVIGAFGAHGLKPHLSEYQISIFEKGVQYQFFHTLAMLFAGWAAGQNAGNGSYFSRAGWLFFAGILCFSGSLYLLACRDLLPFSVAFAGPVTPLGGMFFIAGWLTLFWALRRSV